MASTDRIVDAARTAARRMADRNTPFLFDCWYVAGFAEDFAEGLRARTILGRPLVLYRDREGRAVALDDRCPHRSFPLSRSTRDGDTIVCGYHGLRYDRGGRCIAVPGQSIPPQGIAVRAYPLREQGELVWIWMGEAEPDMTLPVGAWAEDAAGWPASRGYFHLEASYIALHENLLDLTHLSFVHADTIGTPDYAVAPYQVLLDEALGQFAVLRTVAPTRLPPVWGEPTGLAGIDAARIARSEFVAPSAHIVSVRFRAFDAPDDPERDMQIRTAHLVTPETNHSTHYFLHHGRNFAHGDTAVTDFMHEKLFAAFQEDVVALKLVEDMVTTTPAHERYEISISADRAGVAMRRWLLRTIERAAA